MPTFTPVYLNSASYFHNRAIVQAVAVVDELATDVQLVGRVLRWNVGVIGAVCTLNDYYFEWNAGWYNVMNVWDISQCVVTVSGIPVDGGVFFFIDWTPDHRHLVQCARLFVATGDFQLRALPPAPADYWLKLPPLT